MHAHRFHRHFSAGGVAFQARRVFLMRNLVELLVVAHQVHTMWGCIAALVLAVGT